MYTRIELDLVERRIYRKLFFVVSIFALSDICLSNHFFFFVYNFLVGVFLKGIVISLAC